MDSKNILRSLCYQALEKPAALGLDRRQQYLRRCKVIWQFSAVIGDDAP